MADTSQFAVIFYDASFEHFPGGGDLQPAFATDDNIHSALRYIDSVESGVGTCVVDALVRAVDFSANMLTERRRVLLFSDGGVTCPGGSDRPEQLVASLFAEREVSIPIDAYSTVICPVPPTGPCLCSEIPDLLHLLTRETGGICREFFAVGDE